MSRQTAGRNPFAELPVTESTDGVLPTSRPFSVSDDADFARLLTAWPGMPGHIRAAIMALVDVTAPKPE